MHSAKGKLKFAQFLGFVGFLGLTQKLNKLNKPNRPNKPFDAMRLALCALRNKEGENHALCDCWGECISH